MSKVFISYKRDVEPDGQIMEALYDALIAEGHEVFWDREVIKVGDEWGQKIEEEVREADYFIALISTTAHDSDMVKEEIRMAVRQNEKHGNPSILPVRLTYNEAFDYSLDAKLSKIQQLFWNEHADTERIIEALKTAVAHPRDLSLSQVFVEIFDNISDEDAIDSLELPGWSVNIEQNIHSWVTHIREGEGIPQAKLKKSDVVIMVGLNQFIAKDVPDYLQANNMDADIIFITQPWGETSNLKRDDKDGWAAFVQHFKDQIEKIERAEGGKNIHVFFAIPGTMAYQLGVAMGHQRKLKIYQWDGKETYYLPYD